MPQLSSSQDAVQRLRANYYGKVALIDHWFGEILAAFDRKGWLEDTLVVFWSDHGEMLGDHGRVGKCVFYEASVRVPLVLRWPGHIQAGGVSDALTAIIDVFPAILEAVGADPSQRSFGQSLWPAMQNAACQHRDAVFSEILHHGHRNIMARTERYKYAMDETGSGYFLIDLAEDPAEETNLAGHADFRPLEREMRERILAFRASAHHDLP